MPSLENWGSGLGMYLFTLVPPLPIFYNITSQYKHVSSTPSPFSTCFPTETLGIANVDYYWYLNQSGTYAVDGTDDKKEFADTLVSVWNIICMHIYSHCYY